MRLRIPGHGLRLAAAAAATVTLAACGSAGSGGSEPSTPTSASSPAIGTPADVWVAVVGSAKDPGLLDPDRKRILAELGDVLEGSVVVSPGACLQGLPDRLVDGYVLAIQRDSVDDVAALAAQLSETPSFVGAVTVVCAD